MTYSFHKTMGDERDKTGGSGRGTGGAAGGFRDGPGGADGACWRGWARRLFADRLAEAIYRSAGYGFRPNYYATVGAAAAAGGRRVGGGPAADWQVFRSVDGTERYLVEGVAGADTVETVWMPEGDEGETGTAGAEGDLRRKGENMVPGHYLRVEPGGLRAVNCQFCLTARPTARVCYHVSKIFCRHEVVSLDWGGAKGNEETISLEGHFQSGGPFCYCPHRHGASRACVCPECGCVGDCQC